MDNLSSINSGTFRDPPPYSGNTPRNDTSINAPHAFNLAANSSIPVSGASRTSINSPYFPSTTHQTNAQKDQPAISYAQPTRIASQLYQLYKATPSMNLPSDSKRNKKQEMNRPTHAPLGTASIQLGPEASSQKKSGARPAVSKEVRPHAPGPQNPC